jgi:hypothetical protein
MMGWWLVVDVQRLMFNVDVSKGERRARKGEQKRNAAETQERNN